MCVCLCVACKNVCMCVCAFVLLTCNGLEVAVVWLAATLQMHLGAIRPGSSRPLSSQLQTVVIVTQGRKQYRPT